MPDKFICHKIKQLSQKAGVCVLLFLIFTHYVCERNRATEGRQRVSKSTSWYICESHRAASAESRSLLLSCSSLSWGSARFEFMLSGLLALNPLTNPKIFL